MTRPCTDISMEATSCLSGVGGMLLQAVAPISTAADNRQGRTAERKRACMGVSLDSRGVATAPRRLCGRLRDSTIKAA
ncbi:hypothetical protein GCM10027359_19510 [Marilutibacter aestuarii]